ncbi:hypothetical protein RJD24_07500 [Bacillaceae bacterium IKA-2]|nr:hypothetical protein RJD24_07500 [Bacillaceae bacterium IKA-2]
MSKPNFIRTILVIVPWLSVVVLPKKSIRNFFPVSLFASILVVGMCSLAVPYKWWVVKGGWKYKLFNDLSFILGPFFVGTLWIFHFTFGNFKKYFLVNLIIDWIFSYPLNHLFQRMKLYKLVNFKPKHIYFSFLGFALTIYGYQHILKRFK